MSQIATKLDPATLKTLQTDKTLAIGLVEDADGELTIVYTVSGDWINPALDKATKQLEITRWDPGEGRRPRGAQGAPGDAEQRMIEAADANDFVVKGMAVSRKVCPDCVEAIADYEHGPIHVRVSKLQPPAPPAAGGTGGPTPVTAPGQVPQPPQPAPQAGAAAEGAEVPKTVPAQHVPAPIAGAAPEGAGAKGGASEVPKPGATATQAAGEVKPPTGEAPGAAAAAAKGEPSGIGPVAAEAGTAAEFSLSGAILGTVVEAAVFAAIALALQWLAAKAFEMALEADIEANLKPAIGAKLQQLQPKLAQLAGTRKLMVRITYDFIYQRDSPDDPVGSFIQGSPPFYEIGSVRLVNIHPGNEELDFPSSSGETRQPILGPRERVTARSSYSVLLDDAPRRLREKQMAEIVEKHRVKAAPSPPPPTKPSAAPSEPPQPAPAFLPTPAPQQAPPAFNPFPGAPGPSPLQEIDRKLAAGRNGCLQLISVGEGLLSNPPKDDDVRKATANSFLKSESDWRDMVTWWFNFYANNGPEHGRAGCEELLKSDQYGGRLNQIRQTLGG